MKFGNSRFEVVINVATRAALFQAVRDKLHAGAGFAIATLNLDHLTKLPDDLAFADAYNTHDLIVADGRPVVWMSQLAGQSVELMPGSDLVEPLCRLATENGHAVAFVGSSDDALNGAEEALAARIPGLNVVLKISPPFGFDPRGAEADRICEALNASGARFCVMALSAIKQEHFVAHARARCPGVGFGSFGAGLDFLAGTQTRAPRLVRKLALEWFWRILQNPRRMIPRYAKCFAVLPGHMWRSMRAR